jgi:hypothetical protein
MSDHFVLSIDPCLARSEIKAVGETAWEVLFFFAPPVSIDSVVLFWHIITLVCRYFDH